MKIFRLVLSAIWRLLIAGAIVLSVANFLVVAKLANSVAIVEDVLIVIIAKLKSEGA